MRARHALAGSLAVHAGALALLVRAFSSNPPEVQQPPAAEPPIAPAKPAAPSDAIAIELLDAAKPAGSEASTAHESAASGPSERAHGASGNRAGVASVSTRGNERAGTGGERAGHGSTGSGSSLLTMRYPELHLGASDLSAIAGTGELPSAVPITDRLKWRGNRGVINDDVARIDVAPDGTVRSMQRKPDFSIHFRLPLFHPSKALEGLKEMVADWYADPYAMTRGPSAAELPFMYQSMPPCDDCGGMPDPAILSPPPPKRRHERDDDDSDDDDGGGGILSGRMDLTAYLARKFGVGDVYAARKLALLDSTRPEREQRGAAFRAEQLERSAILMRDNLARLGGVPDPAELHRALFELWDECAEGDGPDGDAGTLARGQVIGWIRAHLPAGSVHAFTPAEVAALDAHRSSAQHFAPYDAPP